jgi:peptidoglycan/xylan/chitin deacetylase (PgdA/CDA1 family)
MKQQLINLYKGIAGQLEYTLRPWKYSSRELIVLCMHSTPVERRQQFEQLVRFLLREFRPLNPSQLDPYFKGELSSGPYVLFTFDDGLKNNGMAAEVLEANGVRAVFFVVPDFVTSDHPEAYYRENIRRVVDFSIDHEVEDVTPFTVQELRNLSDRGHAIESHTMSHLLRANSSQEQIMREVQTSSVWIEKNIGRKPIVFCSPIQTNFSVNSQAKQEIAKQYRYHFTTFPGLNDQELNTQLVFRRNIEVHWSLSRIKYSLGRVDLSRWKGETARFQQL